MAQRADAASANVAVPASGTSSRSGSPFPWEVEYREREDSDHFDYVDSSVGKSWRPFEVAQAARLSEANAIRPKVVDRAIKNALPRVLLFRETCDQMEAARRWDETPLVQTDRHALTQRTNGCVVRPPPPPPRAIHETLRIAASAEDELMNRSADAELARVCALPIPPVFLHYLAMGIEREEVTERREIERDEERLVQECLVPAAQSVKGYWRHEQLVKAVEAHEKRCDEARERARIRQRFLERLCMAMIAAEQDSRCRLVDAEGVERQRFLLPQLARAWHQATEEVEKLAAQKLEEGVSDHIITGDARLQREIDELEAHAEATARRVSDKYAAVQKQLSRQRRSPHTIQLLGEL